jgi:hypothetical protein
LTGEGFIHQTIFCAHSFARWTPAAADFVFLSDGSLTLTHADTLRRFFPDASVRFDADQTHVVATALPPEKFPTLHRLRKNFVLLRKLTDTMAGQQGYRMVFDSDMLFWARPDELLGRAAKKASLFMADVGDEGYTASRADLKRAFGVATAQGLNSGLVGVDAGLIDWELMERVSGFLWNAPGDRRLLEQTLWAIILGESETRPLDPQSYRLLIEPTQWSRVRAVPPTPILLHYAWHARLLYSAGEWQRYLEVCAS